MITTADLKSHTKADLTKLAKRLGVTGCSSMLKEDLVKAVAKAQRALARAEAKGAKSNGRAKAVRNGKTTKAVNGSARSNGKASRTVKQVRVDVAEKAVPKKAVARKKAKPKAKAKPTSPKVLKKIRELQLQRETNKDIAFQPTMVQPPGAQEAIWEKEPARDRVALFVRDAYWMHVSWDVTRQAIERAKAALAEHWHSAKPVLRLMRLEDEATNAETIEREIKIHGGLRNWYIEWTGEEASFRVMVGYASTGGRFHSICESNVVTTPNAGSSEEVEDHFSGADAERIFAMSSGYDKERETTDLQGILEDRLQRELGAPPLAKLGASAQSPFRRNAGFHFDMDIEMVVYGSTATDGYLKLNGEPVPLREDGTFSIRLPFPDRRQVLPAVACSRDGSQERMIVVAVERNTKVMEPTEKDAGAE